jgi:hypothetical protein
MVRRVSPLPTSRERSVCALVPLPTAYLMLEQLGRPSVSKAWDVPRRRAAEIRRNKTADGGAASVLYTVGASSSAAEVVEA